MAEHLRRGPRPARPGLIAASFAKHHRSSRLPRITADVSELGWRFRKNTVDAQIAQRKLEARPKRRRRSLLRADKNARKAPDALRRDFTHRDGQIKLVCRSDRDPRRSGSRRPRRCRRRLMPQFTTEEEGTNRARRCTARFVDHSLEADGRGAVENGDAGGTRWLSRSACCR